MTIPLDRTMGCHFAFDCDLRLIRELNTPKDS